MFNGDKAVAKPFSLQNLKFDIFKCFICIFTGSMVLHWLMLRYNILCEHNQYKYLVDDNDNFVRRPDINIVIVGRCELRMWLCAEVTT